MNSTTIQRALSEANLAHRRAVREATKAKLVMELIENAGRYGCMAAIITDNTPPEFGSMPLRATPDTKNRIETIAVMADWGPAELLAEARKLAEAAV